MIQAGLNIQADWYAIQDRVGNRLQGNLDHVVGALGSDPSLRGLLRGDGRIARIGATCGQKIALAVTAIVALHSDPSQALDALRHHEILQMKEDRVQGQKDAYKKLQLVWAEMRTASTAGRASVV